MSPGSAARPDAEADFRAIVLAGERRGGNALAQALSLPAGVLAPLAGKPCIVRVLQALGEAQWIGDTVMCGPERSVVDGNSDLSELLAHDGIGWVSPAAGPAASAAAGARLLTHPILLTSGDHGLLTGAIVDRFCADAWHLADGGRDSDVVVGLVPWPEVQAAFPESRRTVLRFRDGAFCGSNLFALINPASDRALAFWSGVEADRKHPWKIARQLGPAVLSRYALGRLSIDQAFAALSDRAGCRVTWTTVDSPRAAVDVDSEADWQLADRLLSEDRAEAVS